MSHYVLRISQLDAYELDKEILKLLKEQLNQAFHYFPLAIISKWNHEIDLLLELFIWKYSVNKVYATFGQQLLNIRYKGEYNKKKAYLLALLTIGSKYIKNKSYKIKNKTIFNIFHYMELIVKIASTLNLLYFFQEAKFPRFVERLLSLELGTSTLAKRNVGYKYMLRELMWNSFLELLLYTVPLINYHLVKRKFSDFFKRKTSDTNKKVLSKIPRFTLETKCAVCINRPIMPHVMGCSHLFCYYCLKSNVLADPKFECPLCGYIMEDLEELKSFRIE